MKYDRMFVLLLAVMLMLQTLLIAVPVARGVGNLGEEDTVTQAATEPEEVAECDGEDPVHIYYAESKISDSPGPIVWTGPCTAESFTFTVMVKWDLEGWADPSKVNWVQVKMIEEKQALGITFNPTTFYLYYQHPTYGTKLSQDVEVTVPVGDLSPGTYSAVIKANVIGQGPKIPPQAPNVAGTEGYFQFVKKLCVTPPAELNADLSIVKIGPQYAHVGETITFEFSVSNSGPNSATDVKVIDDIAGEATYLSGDTDDDGELDVGETWIFTATYEVKVGDSDPLGNTAKVTSKVNDPNTDNNQASWTVDVLHPEISVTKTADKTKAYAGDTITYTIVVTNIGDCPLYNVNVTDELLGDLLTNGFLDVGRSITFTKTYTVEAGDDDPLVNTVIVEGKDALGLVVSANATASVDLVAKICGYKFYDADMDGVWDNSEPGVEGFKIQLYRNGELVNCTTTDKDGYYCFDGLDAGNYTIVEVLPSNWVNTTLTSIKVTLKSGEVSTGNNFGNVCLKPGYGGRTLGYWANAGNKLITRDDVTYLNSLNLYKPNGWGYPQFSTDINTARTQIRNYLLRATAVDMRWMLSAQLITTVLNVRHGYLSGTTIVYVGPSAYVPSGFISIGNIIEQANAALANNNRAEQTYWKDILDWLNNNRLCFVCPEPCYPITYT